MITGDHVRMIRGALRLSVRQFAEMAGISKMTVSEMERGLRRTYEATSDKIREAFAPYVEFIEPVEGVRGAGVVMKWGVEPIGVATGQPGEESTGKPGEGLHSRSWDEDFEEAEDGDVNPMSDEDRASLRQYYRDYPDRWAKLSAAGKACLARAMRLNDSATPP